MINATDFVYIGQHLSDYNFIICDFEKNNGVEEVSTGSTITFNTVPTRYGRQYYLVNTQHEECITKTFDICKNPNLYSGERLIISDSEFRNMMRWLNKRRFYPFRFVDNTDKPQRHYNASFNISKLIYNNQLYGLRLHMITDSPYAFGKTKRFNISLTSSTSATVVDNSDEIGYLYPDMVITCDASGDLSIHNSLTDSPMIIKNVVSDEVITIKGDSQIIQTNQTNHKIASDFNYSFMKICNTETTRKNIITASLPCSITLTFNPIIKDI